MIISVIKKHPARTILFRVIRGLLPRRWIADNSWMRIFFIRPVILRLTLMTGHELERQGFARKVMVIDDFIESLVVDPAISGYFAGEAATDGSDSPDGDGELTANAGSGTIGAAPPARRGPPGRLVNFLAPGPALHGRFRDFLLGFTVPEEVRCMKLNDLLAVEKERHEVGGKHGPRIFSREKKKAFNDFFGRDAGSIPLPDSYFIHYFPGFDPAEFVKNKTTFILGERKLFGPSELIGVMALFEARMRIRNPRNLFQRAVPLLKKAALALLVMFHLSLLAFDLVMMLYGVTKNEYHYSFPRLGRVIETYDTPYARRAERIFRQKAAARHENFRADGDIPPAWNSYRINNDAQVSVELNYNSYRSLRSQDQNGLTIVAIDRAKLSGLAASDPARHRRFMELVLDTRWWERALSWIDDRTGGVMGLFNYTRVPHARMRDGITGRISTSAAPLEWVDRANKLGGCLTLLYHKPNSMKWTEIGEIPPVMVRAVIVREDSRFRNDIFPIPHRGNDNLVIIPQIAKKLLRSVMRHARNFAAAHGQEWLERKSVEYETLFRARFTDEGRGGSSISNQVMEMLYTKFITTREDERSFTERQVDQKEHELPASLAVDWFWTEDNLLEAYINEVYGGHLSSDIRGFKSEAEMYFMRGLGALNLREQVLLVAAIKKPTRIKEYGQWLKADELRLMMESGRAVTREAVRDWVEENALYRVDRSNYAEILRSREKAKIWTERRINNLLKMLLDDGALTDAQYRDARYRQKISFRFAPGIFPGDSRLVNNIRREIDRELGPERSDSGLVVATTIDVEMQSRLQKLIDRHARRVYVEPEFQVEGQPESVLLEGGARIVRANENAGAREPRVVNQIIADVGGSSSSADEWDWVTLANRSLGSSLKPILDLYFLLAGYNLQDMFRNSRVTYKTYSLEQQRKYQDFIYRNPKRTRMIEEIEKYWSWSPKNYTEYSNEWVSVEDALVRSVNSVHVQIQEIVTPGVFARLLNETMNITGEEGKHRPYRSIILGGSGGDQRYDKFLQAYSIFPNRGVIKKQTYIESLCLPGGATMIPDYRPVRSSLLERYGGERLRAACALISLALRETVRHGTMHAMEGIGAGKTGTSNELRDALATVHFISGNSTYIAGVRLGNRNNYSIGEAADTLAAPFLRKIVTGTFDRAGIFTGEDYNASLERMIAGSREIVTRDGKYFLKGNPVKARRLEVPQIQEEKRAEYLRTADDYFREKQYDRALLFYEGFLLLAVRFDSAHPAFDKMLRCCVEMGNLKRAAQIIERFSLPGRIGKIVRSSERQYGVTIKVNEDFYSGDEEYERRKRERYNNKKKKKK